MRRLTSICALVLALSLEGCAVSAKRNTAPQRGIYQTFEPKRDAIFTEEDFGTLIHKSEKSFEGNDLEVYDRDGNYMPDIFVIRNPNGKIEKIKLDKTSPDYIILLNRLRERITPGD